ncbi:MAG: 1-deoxy-D-xylulose-5-phosphate synthase [Clostridia bacterium]|nr:1-deoxy-D-xylulose-5-phosphate synthase [Clostridia bacterium]
MILETIKTRDDLLALNAEQEKLLCEEIRAFLIKNVSRTGGHLASNLGIVELTVAIQKVFDTSRDRLVFDVGHQCYVHKILTGRIDRFETLRQLGGLSGFPKPCESEHDAFIAGHASNAVSAAFGMAKARTLAGEDYHVIALLGDGALTGGLAYEGLNNVGASREPMIVILNDNGMSITPNVGAIARSLKKARLNPDYLDFKLRYRAATGKTKFGRSVYRITHKLKAKFRQSLLGTTIFENLGFTYLGPVDGHDPQMIASVLRAAMALHEPVLVHVMTQKGRGYEPSEKNPQDYHGVGVFDPKTGIVSNRAAVDFSAVFGKALCEYAESDNRICALTAAMQHGTGLSEFAQAYPNRFFDVGIAEEHAVSMAAGLAKQGMLPVLAIYSTFLQRGFDQLLHDIALQQLHVVFAVDRAGLVGADGETHHGMFDVGYLRQIPGMTVLCPSNFEELRLMLRKALFEIKGPVAIRYPRGAEGFWQTAAESTLLRSGKDLTVVCYGTECNAVLKAAEQADGIGISAEVLKLSRICPLDDTDILNSVRKTHRILVAEECSDRGCLADEIFAKLAQNGISAKCRKVNLGRGFVTHGSVGELLHGCRLDAAGIFGEMQEVLQNEK